MTQAKATANLPTSDLIEVDKALESMRDSGFDLATAVGEVVDNSYEARATIVRIRTVEGKVSTSAKGKSKSKHSRIIDSIAFADNGIGIPHEILSSTLKLGFSTRYNQRSGLGRFGVGAKLAGISQGRRIDIYTRPLDSDLYYHAYLDLDLISQGQQSVIEAEVVDGFPTEYAELMQHPQKGTHFESGTLVIWSKVDRLVDGGKYGSAIQERLQDLTKFLGRAYRKFINDGFQIELNGNNITLHDPLFLIENPTVVENFGRNLQSEIIHEKDLEVDGHNVHVAVTLYPEDFRRERGKGGKERKKAEEKEDNRFRGLYIPENQGRISIVRNGREIYYDIVPKLLPSGIEDIDRFIGIEVSFPAVLDEYLQVRHVKRGAEPVSKLRESLKEFLRPSIRIAREKIRTLWKDTEAAQRNASSDHKQVEDAVEQAEQTLPKGKGGLNLDMRKQQQIVDNLLVDLGINPSEEPEKAEEVKQRVQERPITIVDGNWPGKELFEINHLNGRAIIRINHRHLFIQQVYDLLKELADREPTSLSAEEAIDIARKAEIGLDILFMAYAKAENMQSDPEMYEDLRSYWGQHAYAYTREALGDK